METSALSCRRFKHILPAVGEPIKNGDLVCLVLHKARHYGYLYVSITMICGIELVWKPTLSYKDYITRYDAAIALAARRSYPTCLSCISGGIP